MVLPDWEIRQCCVGESPLISPFEPEHLQPASVDLTLSELFLVPASPAIGPRDPIDMRDVKGTYGNLYHEIRRESFTLDPLRFVLGSTMETVWLDPWLMARVEGKSSLGRLGLTVHQTAGFIDPGFRGTITLEMFNTNDRPITMWAGQRICQISFSRMNGLPHRLYGDAELGSKYQGQTETTGSRMA
jgi:dCTP deaminase